MSQLTIETLDMQFNDLFTQINGLSKNVKPLQVELKGVYKTFKLLDRHTRLKKKRPQVKLFLSSDLEKFLCLDHGTKATKAEVMKMVSSYIKEKNLQVQIDKRRFIPNKELSKIFGVKGKPSKMTFVEINKHVSPHLSK